MNLALAIPRPNILPVDLVLGDFNGDGNLDLAVSYADFDSNPTRSTSTLATARATSPRRRSVTVGINPNNLVSIPRPFLDAGTFAVTDHGPVANNDQATVDSGSSVSIPVLANDTDSDNVPLTITQVTAPAHGVAHIISNGSPNGDTIQYTPAPRVHATTASRIPLPTRTAWSQRQRLRLLSRASSLRRRSWQAPLWGRTTASNSPQVVGPCLKGRLEMPFRLGEEAAIMNA